MVHGKIKEQSSKYNLLSYWDIYKIILIISKKLTSEMSIPNSLSPFPLIHERMAGLLYILKANEKRKYIKFVKDIILVQKLFLSLNI